MSRLILLDTFGLAKFRPSLRVAPALIGYLLHPSVRTHDMLHRRCIADLDGVRSEMDCGQISRKVNRARKEQS